MHETLVMPFAQKVNASMHRFAQDDFLLVERGRVEQALVRSRRVKVLHRAPLDPPPVIADDFSGRIEQRHDDAAVKVLVAAFAPHAKLGQSRPQQLSRFSIGIGQPQPQRPVAQSRVW